MRIARIINAMVWVYLAMSDALAPVFAGDYWTVKLHQLAQLGPLDDPARMAGRAVIPAILWFTIDRWLKRRIKARQV